MDRPREIIKELRPHALWSGIEWMWRLMEAMVMAALVAFWQYAHSHIDGVLIGIVFLGSVGVLVLGAMRKRAAPKDAQKTAGGLTLPNDPPALFVTTRPRFGATAADNWADVGAFDVLIRQATVLKELLENIRESDTEKKYALPLADGALPANISEYRDKQLWEFRVLFNSHLEILRKVADRFTSVLTLIGFPAKVQSLDVLRAVDDHIDSLEKARQLSLGKAWKRAVVGIYTLISDSQADYPKSSFNSQT